MKNYDLMKEILPIELIQAMHENTLQQRIKKQKEMAETWEKETRAELNKQLIEKGSAKKIISAADMKEYSRNDIVNICERLVKEFKEAGYIVWAYKYSYSNQRMWYSIDIDA